MFGRLDQAKTREDLLAAARYLKGVPGGNGKVGAVGFCWGGGMVNLLATRLPELAAAVPFYGAAPPAESVAAIQAPLLLMFADNDDNVNRDLAGLRGGAEGRRQALRGASLSGHAARLQQRHDAALRRRRRRPGLAAHGRLLQPHAARLSVGGGAARPRAASAGRGAGP